VAIIVENKITSFVDPSTAGGRLSVDAADPVGEGTNATLYYLPYVGNLVAIYDGSSWVAREFTSPSLDVSALVAGQVYDVFAAWNGTAVTLEAVAWSNHGAGTGARATAIVQQDGVWVRTDDATRRLLGSICTVNDSGVKARDLSPDRYVSNVQNRVLRKSSKQEATATWDYTTATWREANGAANRISFVTCLSQDIEAQVLGMALNSGTPSTARSVGLGLNSTSVNSAQAMQCGQGAGAPGTSANLAATLPEGYSFVAWLE